MPAGLPVAGITFDSSCIARLAGNPSPAERSGSISRDRALQGLHREMRSLNPVRYPVVLGRV